MADNAKQTALTQPLVEPETKKKFGATPARWWVLFIFFQLSINQV